MFWDIHKRKNHPERWFYHCLVRSSLCYGIASAGFFYYVYVLAFVLHAVVFTGVLFQLFRVGEQVSALGVHIPYFGVQVTDVLLYAVQLVLSLPQRKPVILVEE